ncbi:tRNA-dihydrouridine(47) synthase [NAD(P)(+)]-like isoform X1 [Telopea speciosissima]|uniref:tRNA-dihydrouridine(47) synthase [NAD(P)(+)]-like isoform X1 n=1 Tax=Telopea speciosissima TaxID=54955 RepID=UPI001CC80FCF|nr:tRNA-dihydrouridine(47) synthase [NAD(P)(+)]-like isoform X1 [Telopea speciosissima]
MKQLPPHFTGEFGHTMDESSSEVEVKVSEDVSLPNTEVAVSDTSPLNTEEVHLTQEELVAKAIAPVKREYLRPRPVRPSSNGAIDVRVSEQKSISSNVVTENKKSKRQLKRERRQEQKSSLHICPEVAKTGTVSSCRYGDNCRFSHDLEAFKAQKPADLEGNCPFASLEKPCPYGVACRFSGSHKDGAPAETLGVQKMSYEMNGLNKDVQKLLWKNKMCFSRADAQLKCLGLSLVLFHFIPELQGQAKSKSKTIETKNESDQDVLNGSIVCHEDNDKEVGDSDKATDCTPEVPSEQDMDVQSDDLRPQKKAKIPVDENCCFSEVDNGSTLSGNDFEENNVKSEAETKPSDTFLTETDMSLKLHPREKKLIDFGGKLYLAPLTTVGNLPFRRVCRVLGADITCGEMAMCTNLLQGQASEWALLRRHSSEDLFGVQICGAYPDTIARTIDLIDRECTVDFIDINMGCPIDIVVNRGAGSSLLTKPMRMKSIIQAASGTVDTPITVKVRTAYFEGKNRIDSLISDIGQWGATAVTIHGRSRQQRYSKLANWDYIYQCTRKAPDSLQVLGNGDVFSHLDWNNHKSDCPELSTCMIARGALIKPWIFTEIKEQRHWDISSTERLNILKDFAHFGLEHWGSDNKGVETTRHFLLEWLSYTHRYIPVGLLDVIPQKLNWRAPSYFGRNDLETLMASESAADWIRISEMLLGKVPAGFTFAPKHKSNAYDSAENG